jgi:hypothetical protein
MAGVPLSFDFGVAFLVFVRGEKLNAFHHLDISFCQSESHTITPHYSLKHHVQVTNISSLHYLT